MNNDNNDWQQPSGLPPQMQNRFEGNVPNPAGFDPSQGNQGGPSKTPIILGLVAAAGLFVMLMGVGLVFFLVSSDDEVVEAPVEVVAVAPATEEAKASMDDVKKFVMERATAAEWEYTWKETRDTGLYLAASVVFNKRKKRAGLTIFIADEDTLAGIESDTEKPDVVQQLDGALLIWTPMPGKPIPEKLWESFQKE